MCCFLNFYDNFKPFEEKNGYALKKKKNNSKTIYKEQPLVKRFLTLRN